MNNPNPFSLKEDLPVDYVLHHYGFAPVREESQALLYTVPWRPDDHPSLAVFARKGSDIRNGWADRAAQDASGDLFDLIAHIEGVPTGQALAKAEEIHALWQTEEDYVGPPVPDRVTTSAEEMEAYVNRAKLEQQEDPAALASWLYERGAPYTASWLSSVFRVSAIGGEILMPYLDEDGTFVSFRRRSLSGGKVMSVAGSTMDTGYGLWMIDPARPLVICEGESDVWAGTFHLGSQFNFVGVPGASIRPESIDVGLTADIETVYLCFDGDRAGRDASARWYDFLAQTGIEDVRVVAMPEGKDLSDIRQPRPLFDEARRADPLLHGVTPYAGRYVRLNKDGGTGRELSDFVAAVRRTISSPDGTMFEVEINGREYVVRPWDLGSSKQFRGWCLTNGLLWNGNDQELVMLISLWKSQSLFLPSIEGTSVAGLHDGTFVWPGGGVGDRDMRYVPGIVDGFEPGDFRMSPSPSPRLAAETVLGFLELSPHSVTTPMLAWLAAAPLRSQARTFPYLSISGEYGAGKSAYINDYIPAITGLARKLGLGSAPSLYAMTSLMAAGNAFPVLFDEFRNADSAANNAMLANVANVIRASWDAGVRETGGHPLDPKRKIKSAMSSPLVVAGEVEQSEGSTRERMVSVYLVKALQGDETRLMRAVHEAQGSAFAPLYLRFLLQSPIDGEAARIDEVYGGPVHLDNRMRITVGYLEQGWALLSDFMASLGHPIDHISLDLSGVLAAFEETQSLPPLLSALREVLSSTHPLNPAVWEEDGEVFIKPGQFSKEASMLKFTLGDARTVGKSLQTVHGGERRRISKDGQRPWVVVLDAQVLEGADDASDTIEA